MTLHATLGVVGRCVTAALCCACGGGGERPLFSDVAPPDAQRAPVADPGPTPGNGAGASPAGSAALEPGASGEGLQSSQGLPCGVQGILRENCVRCHAPDPQFGAPMPLVTYADLTAPAATQPDRSVAELVLERIASDAAPMPPVPNERLSNEERAALRAWVDAGALNVEELCRAIEQTPPPDTFIGIFPPDERCDVPIVLNANAGGDQPFTVPLEDDHYECFYFKAPVDPVQILGFAPIVDDSRVLHHWLLYANEDGSLADGGRETCTGIHPDATLLGGWAPGGLAYGMPDGVGLEIPASGEDARFILEIHYNNVARRSDARDRSGVRLCGTREPQPNVAAVHWLGTENIFLLPGQSEAGSTCEPDLSEPVQLLSITPHMHQLGVHSRVVLERADGSEEMLLDEPFDFNTQIGYETSALMQPGDRLTATCRWNNDSGGLTRFGEGTDDEMCYFFTLAYPAGSLNTGNDFILPGLLGGVNKCMR